MALLIASLRDSRAKTFPWPAGVQASMASDPAFSSTSSTMPTLAVRDTSFWRTSQGSLLPQPPLWTKLPPPKLLVEPTDLPEAEAEALMNKFTKRMALYSKEQPPASWENWPIAGGMRNGSLFHRPMWAPAMDACDGSAGLGDETWPTPAANEFEGGDPQKMLDRREREKAKGRNGNGFGLTLGMAVASTESKWLTPAGMAGMDHTGKAGAGGEFAQQATNWQTPAAADASRTGNYGRGEGNPTFSSQAKQWATPTSSENSNRGSKIAPSHGNGHGFVLAGQAGQWEPKEAESSVGLAWPTPRGTDGTKGGPNQAGSKGDLMLPSAAAQFLPVSAWPTPAARDAKGPNSEAHVTTNGTGRMHMDQLANFVAFSPLVQQTPDGQTSSPPVPTLRRHLNPLFGAKLMGWPSTWTIAEPHGSSASATVLFRSQLQQQLSCFFGVRGS
ncbi:hypothetical protein D9M73_68950 [compost metagenome]